jgi:Protein of unknown function (DUF1553)
VTSSVYRQSAAPRPDALRIDPDNRLLSRYPLRRIDAEAMRDAILAITGELVDRQGGPYVQTDRDGSGEVVVAESAEGANRRSVYLRQRRTEITSLLELFDAPSIVTTCTRRMPSTIPLQSLSLMNSEFMIIRARKLATRLERDCNRNIDGQADHLACIERAFLLAIGRPPAPDERAAACRFVATQPSRYPGLAESERRHHAMADFCQMLLASNAFLYVD